jgi:glycogen phosphorylase
VLGSGHSQCPAAEVKVELYAGRVDADGQIVEAHTWPMQPTNGNDAGGQWFETASVPCGKSGLQGFTVRVLPHHPDLSTKFLPGLIVWAGPGVQVKRNVAS